MKFIQLTDYSVVEERYFSIYIEANKIVKIWPAKEGSYVETIDGRTSPVKETPEEVLSKIGVE